MTASSDNTTSSIVPPSRRDYTKGSLLGNLLLLGAPMTTEMLLFSLYGMVDFLWVGRLGWAALAAATASSTLRFSLNSMSMGLGRGAAAMVARRVGARDLQGASNVVMQAVYLSLALSIPLSITGLLLAEPVLRLLGADPEVVPLASAYLRITFAGLFATIMLPIINSLLRAAGNAATSLGIRLLVIAVSLAVEWPLIFGLGPLLPLGIRGSALATVLGRAVGVAVQLLVLTLGTPNIRLGKRHWRPRPRIMWQIIRTGTPAAASRLVFSSVRIILLRIVAPYGMLAWAGYGVANRIGRTVRVLGFGVGNASATLVGQNLGAGRPARAERSARLAAGVAVCLMFAGSIPALIWAEAMIRAFNPSPDVVTVGATCLRILASAWAIGAVGTVMSQSLSGAGDTITPMIISLLTQWAILVPLAYGLARLLGTNGIWTAITLTSVANAAILATLFSRGRWKLVKL